MFCAGLDIKPAAAPPSAPTPTRCCVNQREFSGLVMRMRRRPQPIIGLLHGHAAGGGFSIALAATCASPPRARR